MIGPKNELENSLLSITKNCETLIEQTHRKLKETLEFKMTKPKGTINFHPPFEVKEDCMLGLDDLEVYYSIFNMTEENNKLEFYIFLDEISGDVSYIKVRDEINKDFDISEITACDSEDDIIAPIFIEEYREQVTKRMEETGYTNNLQGYIRSIFQVFERSLRTEVDLVENGNWLVLDKYN